MSKQKRCINVNIPMPKVILVSKSVLHKTGNFTIYTECETMKVVLSDTKTIMICLCKWGVNGCKLGQIVSSLFHWKALVRSYDERCVFERLTGIDIATTITSVSPVKVKLMKDCFENFPSKIDEKIIFITNDKVEFRVHIYNSYQKDVSNQNIRVSIYTISKQTS